VTPNADADADAQHRKNLCADPFEPGRIGDATETGRRGSP
jgi:hypothetical protein